MHHEAADGILKTSVTWAEFESHLRSSLATDARLSKNKSVLDIGDGNGFASCCGLLTCDWIGAATDEQLPKAVVLKIPSSLPMRRLNDSLPPGQRMFDYDEEGWKKLQSEMEEVHNVEVATYKYFAQFKGIAMPRMYYGRPAQAQSGAGQICFEYIANSRMMAFHERHTVDQVRQIARALGKIQACSIRKEPTDAVFQQDFFKILAETWPLDTFRGMFKGIFDVDSSEKTKQLMEKIDVLLPNFFSFNIASSIHKRMNVKPVLVNGDLHTGNVLIDKDTGNLAALIDWQCTHFGIGVEDLYRVAMSALTTKERRAAMPMLVEEMYKSMVAHLEDTKPPYSLDTLLILSDIIFPQCALFFTSNFIPFVVKFDNNLTISDAEKAARKEIMFDKVIGCLEDVVKYESKNKKHITDLKL